MSSSSSPCAACKFLQRNCTQRCVFAPYFSEDQQRFSNVFHVYGTSCVAKMLNKVSPEHRKGVANSLAYQADMRVIYPVHGCLVDFLELLELKEEVRQGREILELIKLQKEIEEEIRQKREILELQEKLQEEIKEEIRQKREILELQDKLQEEIKEKIRQKREILELQEKLHEEIKEEIIQKIEILELQEGIRQKRQRVLAPATDAATDRAATAPRAATCAAVVADDDSVISLGPCSDADEPTTTALSSSLDNYFTGERGLPGQK